MQIKNVRAKEYTPKFEVIDGWAHEKVVSRVFFYTNEIQNMHRTKII